MSQSLSLLINIVFLFLSDKFCSILIASHIELNAHLLASCDLVFEASVHGSINNCVVKSEGVIALILLLACFISESYFCWSTLNVDLS